MSNTPAPKKRMGRPPKYQNGETYRNIYLPIADSMNAYLTEEARRRECDRSDLIRAILRGTALEPAADDWNERYLIAEGMARGTEVVVHLRAPGFVARLYRPKDRAEAEAHEDALRVGADVVAQFFWLGMEATDEQQTEIVESLGRYLRAYRARYSG